MRLRTWQLIFLTTAVLSLSSPVLRAQDQGSTPSGSYTTYVVKWYETLDDVAAKFGIPKDILMAYNGLESEKLSKKQKLRIPDDPSSVVPSPPATTEESAPVPPEESADTALTPQLFPGLHSLEDHIPAIFKSRPEVALLLPLGASAPKPDEGSFDFYSGALMAVRDLSAEGVGTRLEVIDTKASVPDYPSLDGCDLIIGPVEPAGLDSLVSHCPGKIPVISPLDPKGIELASRHANLIQAPTPFAGQYPAIIEWLTEELQDGDRVILLMEKGTAPTPLFDHLSSSDLTYSLYEYGILEGRRAIDAIAGMMSPDAVNRVLIASDNEAFVNDAIRNLNLMKFKGFEVTMYGTSRIRGFDTIEVENLHNIHARVVCTYFVDYTSPAVQKFLMSYRALFGTEPTPFAFQGYDVTRFFVNAFSSEGSFRKRMHRATERRWRGLQSDFDVQPAGEGYANRAVRRIIYDDSFRVVLQ